MKVIRYMIQLIAGSVLFAFFNNVFAKDSICPSSDIIKNIVFTQAYHVKGNTLMWTLVSDAFNYKNNPFNVIFTLNDHAVLPSVALKKGQNIFSQVNLYSIPRQTTDAGYIFCTYADNLRGNDGYQVVASNPPYPYPL